MPQQVVYAEVSDTPLSVDRALAAVADPTVGGVGLFVGVVRNHDDGQQVSSLEYSAHPTAGHELAQCADDVARRYDVTRIAVEHRIGSLDVGDLAVVVAVGAAHRAEALDACRALIDLVKQRVPIWKEQFLLDGGSQWVGS